MARTVVSGWWVRVACLGVVGAAVVTTAHGLFEVACAAGTPAGIAWLYPVITDGLALVAYACTPRLRSAGLRYAWLVVLLAAGLSGLAQASYLAGGVTAAAAWLRFGVGAWPAVAAAVAAHLFYLLGATAIHHNHTGDTTQPQRSGHPEPGVLCPPVAGRGEVSLAALPDPQPRDGDHQDTPPDVPAECLSHPEPAVRDGSNHPEPDDGGGSDALGGGVDQEPGGEPPPAHLPGSPPGDRARVFAELHRRRSGVLPTVRELAALAEVGRGTATRALRELREHPPTLRLVGEDPMSAGPDLDQEKNP